MTVRALVFGASGQLGSELQRSVPQGSTIVPLDLADVNICVRQAVADAIKNAKADVVVNCAAFTNVDGAETARQDAMETNGVAPGVVAEEAGRAGARMLHLSTDYVFDGCANSPYGVAATPAPLSVYGATKLEGERRVLAANVGALVVRTAWLHSGVGANFVRTTVRLLSSGKGMRVVDDQIGTPTRARHLATALWRLAERRDVAGIVHFTDAGVASWYDVARAVLDALNERRKLPTGASVEPIPTAQWPSAARRPLYSVLDKHDSWKTIGFVPPHWREGVVATTHELLDA